MLALSLCLVFVAFLLKLDHQRFKPQSMAGWIPTVWMLNSAAKPFGFWYVVFFGYRGRWIEDLSERVIEGSPVDRNFLLVLIGVGLLILARRKINWRQVVTENRWLLLLFFYMLVSISWSDYPFVSLKRWIKASGIILMALIVLTGPSPREEIESILRRMAYILIPFSLLLVKYFPHLGRKWGRYSGVPMWTGVTYGKNELGLLCVIAVLFLIWTWAKTRTDTERPPAKYEKMANVAVLGLALYLLKGPGLAYSATAMVILTIGLTTLFILRHRKLSTHLLTMACLLTLLTGLVYPFMWNSLSINPVAVVASLTNREANLTGRDRIWDELIPVFRQNPVLGVGYGGYWIAPLEFEKLTVNEAHNGYLDVLIELGVVGIILLTFAIAAFFTKATESFQYDIEWGSFLLIFVLISLLHNITESSYVRPTMLIWNVLVLLFVAYPRNKEIVPL
jgi:O-antigen ligase